MNVFLLSAMCPRIIPPKTLKIWRLADQIYSKDLDKHEFA